MPSVKWTELILIHEWFKVNPLDILHNNVSFYFDILSANQSPFLYTFRTAQIVPNISKLVYLED